MRSLFWLTAGFFIVFLIPRIFHGAEAEDWAKAYGLNNSNIDQSAFFWVKTSDGKTSVIEVPPQSEKKLPLNTVDFQFLFMEKGISKEAFLKESMDKKSLGREEAKQEIFETAQPALPDFSKKDAAVDSGTETLDTNQKLSRLRKFYRDYI